MRHALLISLIAGLALLVVLRPWARINQALGIRTTADSLSTEPDSLLIDQVAIGLPDIISDSLRYSVRARTKKKAYLEEQSRLLQLQDQKLEAALKKKRKKLERKEQERQALERQEQEQASMDNIDRLLEKQNGKGKRSARTLNVSDVEGEVKERAKEAAGPPPSSQP